MCRSFGLFGREKLRPCIQSGMPDGRRFLRVLVYFAWSRRPLMEDFASAYVCSPWRVSRIRPSPRGRKILCSVTCLMSFCLSLRVQLKCRIAATRVPFWPDRPLGSEPTWPPLHTVHRAQSTAHHNLVAQVSAAPLLCQTNAWAPAPNAVCTCPETTSRGGE